MAFHAYLGFTMIGQPLVILIAQTKNFLADAPNWIMMPTCGAVYRRTQTSMCMDRRRSAMMAAQWIEVGYQNVKIKLAYGKYFLTLKIDVIITCFNHSKTIFKYCRHELCHLPLLAPYDVQRWPVLLRPHIQGKLVSWEHWHCQYKQTDIWWPDKLLQGKLCGVPRGYLRITK